jgi:ATP-dependent DNA helicase PIF1
MADVVTQDITEPEEATQYPTEFFNSLEPTGLPPHTLTLKTGCPVMLLRNLDPPKLCNGTRLIIKQVNNNVIEATILTGQAKGQVFLPRIPLPPSDCPISFKQLQFPHRPCFAMTINKAQSCGLKHGISLLFTWTVLCWLFPGQFLQRTKFFKIIFLF